MSSWKQALRRRSDWKVHLWKLRNVVEISLHIEWIVVDIAHALNAWRRRIGGIVAAKITRCLTKVDRIWLTWSILRTLAVKLNGVIHSVTRIHAINAHIPIHIIQVGQVLWRQRAALCLVVKGYQLHI